MLEPVCKKILIQGVNGKYSYEVGEEVNGREIDFIAIPDNRPIPVVDLLDGAGGLIRTLALCPYEADFELEEREEDESKDVKME